MFALNLLSHELIKFIFLILRFFLHFIDFLVSFLSFFRTVYLDLTFQFVLFNIKSDYSDNGHQND